MNAMNGSVQLTVGRPVVTMEGATVDNVFVTMAGLGTHASIRRSVTFPKRKATSCAGTPKE